MSEKKNNWAVWFDNKADYKIGDVVLYSLNYGDKKVSVVKDIFQNPLSDRQKKDTESWVAKQKNCCGREGRGIRQNENVFTYQLENEEDVVNQVDISGGIDEVNEELKRLNESIESMSKRQQQAAEALGYSDDY